MSRALVALKAVKHIIDLHGHKTNMKEKPISMSDLLTLYTYCTSKRLISDNLLFRVVRAGV